VVLIRRYFPAPFTWLGREIGRRVRMDKLPRFIQRVRQS
jgi:hypothetical protein